MIDSIKWFLSLRRNINFWDWVRDTYSFEDLKLLEKEATDCSLIRPYNPFAEVFVGRKNSMRKTTKRLMKRYGDEIIDCCLGAGGYDIDKGIVGLNCLSNLDLASQIYNIASLEEFLVRNALKRVAYCELNKKMTETQTPNR